MNGISIHVNDISICFDTPKPRLRHFRLAAGDCSPFLKDMILLYIDVFVNMSDIFKCIGIPKPHLRVSGLRQALGKTRCLFKQLLFFVALKKS